MTAVDRFGEDAWLDADAWRGVAAHLVAPDGAAPIRVLVVDDHFLFVEMLALALEIDERFEVVGHASNGEEAIERAAWLRPDLVLMDIDMPVLDGIAATPRVLAASPRSKVVIVTSSDAMDDRRRAETAGAAGYVSKGVSAEELLRAVERVVSRVVALHSPQPADRTPPH